ncbi:hypothetical protein [Flavobacterium sp.]|jgi:hypothetical protein|uniref:hypothetical protein n=1 Tax=Flavobacterium sp. TaxID=239 RepID=UPI0037C14C4C
MKKYILATILTVAFSINSNAQESKIVEETPISQVSIYDTKATSDINDIKPYVKLTADLEKNLHGLFRAKHKMLFNAKDDAAKATIKEGIEMKLVSIIGRDNVAKVKANATLFEKLMN